MSKPYEIEITETRTVVTKVMVEADGWREAQAKALRGDVVVAGEPRQIGDPVRTASDHEMVKQGATLQRVAPGHPFVAALALAESSFDRVAAGFAAAASS